MKPLTKLLVWKFLLQEICSYEFTWEETSSTKA